MTEYSHECKICGHEQTVGAYNDFNCAGCGQEYIYDEGHAIVLTDAQRAILKLRAKRAKRAVMPTDFKPIPTPAPPHRVSIAMRFDPVTGQIYCPHCGQP